MQRLTGQLYQRTCQAAVLAPKSDLVDAQLSAQRSLAASQVARSLTPVAGMRAISVFLEKDDYTKVSGNYAPLRASLMLECLPAFVQQGHGQIVLGLRFDHDGNVHDTIESTITVAGRSRIVLEQGNLFIQLRNERVVVSADHDKYPDGSKVSIAVRSSVDSISFRRRWEEFAETHSYLKGQSFFADGEIIERNSAYSWDDILLSQDAKVAIQTHVEGFLRNRLKLRDLGVKCRRGLILSGPPGTGKTLLGKVLSSTLGTSFMWVLPRHISNQKSFQDILTVARYVAPTVVFLEDLDLFAEEREGNKWLGLGELMNQLDGAQENDGIVTIATTNRLEIIEKALRNRPGRFDRIVEIGPLDDRCRRELLTKLLSKSAIREEEMAHLVAATGGYTGAQVQELANTVYLLAVNEDNPSAPDDGRMSVTRQLIDRAMDEFQVEKKARLGFHVA